MFKKKIEDRKYYSDIAKIIYNTNFNRFSSESRFVSFLKLVEDHEIYLFYELLNGTDLHGLLENSSFLNERCVQKIYIFLKDVD